MAPHTLFEVSWEVGNKVGGIHTVVSTKAKTLVERLGDAYVVIGPWLLSEGSGQTTFVEAAGYEAFAESCRALGAPVRVGRWQIPGRPLTVLVEFSRLFEQKDTLLARLWEQHGVDSLFGDWDYIEPVVFGHAAGLVIERWLDEYGERGGGRAIAQFHEWLTGAGLLHLKAKVPAVGTVFTTHATTLGRALASRGSRPTERAGGRGIEELAIELGVRSKHSLEAGCARAADVFTTVSTVTAAEAELFCGRPTDLLLPNGIDLEVMDELAGAATRDEVARELRRLASRLAGEDLDDAALLCISGRYEFHNKGIDLLLDAIARVNQRPGRKAVLFVMVPAGQSGVRGELLDRLRTAAGNGALGLSTHNLFDAEHDPVQQRCRELGLLNQPDSRVKIVQIPIYCTSNDGLLNLPYEAVLRAMDLSCFPSFYEPWGYTPEESLAMGVPTITTDCAGFGLWAKAAGLTPKDGVHVLARDRVPYEQARDELAKILEEELGGRGADRAELAAACRRTAQATAWSDLIRHYTTAFERALVIAAERVRAGVGRPPRRVTALAVAPAAQQRPQLRRFDVLPTIPAPLRGLEQLARNLWWSWQPDVPRLFEELAPQRFAACGRNPVALLQDVYTSDLVERAQQESYVRALRAAGERLQSYLSTPPDERHGVDPRRPVAYFCAEYGLHESLPIYSGGLGVLAGDHLKSASDLGLPLVAIGLFYRKGYLDQRLSAEGLQIAVDAENDPARLPLELVRGRDGAPLTIDLALPSSTLALHCWRVQVGRVTLHLLDSDVTGNRPEDRAITHRLYGGDQENRLRQEIVLGRGGVRLLALLGLEPGAWHLNEGHAAFVAIERIGQLLRDGMTFDEASLLIRSTTSFTTHTPIPAGHDEFPEALMRRYFSDVDRWAGVPWERFFGFGNNGSGLFNMTYLAARFAGFVNGVSQQHGEVSRGLIAPIWPTLLAAEVPVHAISNGVHLPSWAAPEIARLLGASGRPVSGDDYRAADALDTGELWQCRQLLRRRLGEQIARRTETAWLRRHDSPALLQRVLRGLEPADALWIGFARRFAPYKRADLILRDPQRLEALLASSARPVRLIFAGKAHPQDGAGQGLLTRIVQLARSDAFAGRLLFVEDYDLALARALVQGVDVWLNNPIRPLEASGTSGMKAATNGVLNLSIADGWWAEVEAGCGWTIGNSHPLPSQALQDEMDSSHLFRLLEEEIVPLFFDRDAGGAPRRWLDRVRQSLRLIPPRFDTHRMVRDYVQLAYAGAARCDRELRADHRARLRAAAERHHRVRKGFAALRIVAAGVTDLRDAKVFDTIEAQVSVDLGELLPDDLRVELVLGHARGPYDLQRPIVVPLHPVQRDGSVQTFAGAQPLERSGAFGYGLRIRAAMPEPWDRALSDLVLWAADS
jgi:phosphorylase/glycogen(starch) synthase